MGSVEAWPRRPPSTEGPEGQVRWVSKPPVWLQSLSPSPGITATLGHVRGQGCARQHVAFHSPAASVPSQVLARERDAAQPGKRLGMDGEGGRGWSLAERGVVMGAGLVSEGLGWTEVSRARVLAWGLPKVGAGVPGRGLKNGGTFRS